jgi:hypothetical protein
MVGNPLAYGSSVVWDVGGKGFFDATNKAYPIQDGRVQVDLATQPVRCPTGLGHLADGREPVKEIQFLFKHEKAESYWLHVAWNPGGSGKEQFEVLCNEESIGKSTLIDAKEKPDCRTDERFKAQLHAGDNVITLRHLSGDGLRFYNVVLCDSERMPPSVNPNLKFPTVEAYEAVIREPAVMLDGLHVCLFAPKQKAKEAKLIFDYLVKAYDELYRIVGVDTEYKIVVYHFPPGSPHAFGGTSNCTIWYDYKNLDLAPDEEWKRYHVPHVSGYIEEMAHNFVSTSHAQFGWEMIGWTISSKVSEKIAGNPIYRRSIQETRKGQAETFHRYVKANYVFPNDLPANLCDRVHAYLLWQCERQYGPNFWPDFFAEIRKELPSLTAAVKLGDNDSIRNKRYQITIECFDRLKGLDFKKKLQELHISLDTDVKSLKPQNPGWNRKLTPSVASPLH